MPIKNMMTIRELKDAVRRYRALHRGGLPKRKKGSEDFRYDIEKRAKQGLRITRKRIIEDKDDDGDTYRKITCTVVHPIIENKNGKNIGGSGAPHTLEILIYDMDGNEDNAKIACNCDCEHFLYACEMALTYEGSARIEEPFEMRIWSNGEDYTENGPNPSKIAIICKHIYAAILAGLFKWKKPPLSLEEQRKLEIKKQREEKQRLEKEKKEKLRMEQLKKERAKREQEKTRKEKLEKGKSKKSNEPKKGIKKPPAIKQTPKPPPSKWKRRT